MKAREIAKLMYFDEVFYQIEHVKVFDLLLRRVIGADSFEIIKIKKRDEWHALFWAMPEQVQMIRLKMEVIKSKAIDEEYEELLDLDEKKKIF